MEQAEKKAKLMGERFKEIRMNSRIEQMLINCDSALSWLKAQHKSNAQINYKHSIEKYEQIRYYLGSKGRGKVSAQTAGEILGAGRNTILRRESGETGKKGGIPLNDDQLAVFATLTGTHLAYLKGETDEADPRAYAEKCDAALSDAMAEHEDEIAAEIKKLKIMFGACGYQYESIAGTGAYEFDGLDGSPLFAGPHKLTDPAGVNETVYLSDPELQALQARLGDTVAFECFRIKRGRDKENGNG